MVYAALKFVQIIVHFTQSILVVVSPIREGEGPQELLQGWLWEIGVAWSEALKNQDAALWDLLAFKWNSTNTIHTGKCQSSYGRRRASRVIARM